METNICWARDADSGPVGLCSYSWVCVRAVRDSWLIYLVLSLVHYCGVQSCVWLLTCQRGRKSEGKQSMACAPVGFVCCSAASPTARCVHGGLWPCTGAMLALSKNMFYTAQTCHLILFFFLSFCWQNFVGQKTCSLFPQDWGVFKHFSP